MLRLTTFDGVMLYRDGTALPAIMNRKLSVALLLVLAIRGRRGMSRDALIELLWPDNAVKDPRHSMDQLLTVTRSLTGEPGLFVGSSTLMLAANVIQTDVESFEAAARDHRSEELVALYKAPFADGFTFGGSSELEDMIDNARTRFAIDHATSVRSLAEKAERSNNAADAVRWWRVLYESDQSDTSVVLHLIAALSTSNRRADALRLARNAAATYLAEYGRQHPEIARWLVRLGGHDGASEPMVSGETVRVVASTNTPPSSSQIGVGHRSADNGRMPTPDGVIAGRYRLDRVLRAGRIATVHSATDAQQAGARVEVHVLEGPVAACMPTAHFAEVFGRVCQLSHANILPTLDAGSPGAMRFIVTAPTPASGLDERLKQKRPMPIAEAVSIAGDIAAGLAYAHDRGVFHGDLRPRRIALNQNASVTGFGLAESIEWGTGSEHSAILTLGSTLYHSPEQLMAETRLDAASDVYAFGCMLFEMLVGEAPFGGPTRPNRMLKLSQPAPSVRELRETVPVELAEIVRRCLARVPADRYGSGTEVIRDMSSAREWGV